MKTIVISGFRSFELGIFKTDDKKIEIIQKVLRKKIIELADEGVEWFLISGNLGVECWAAEVIIALKKEYPTIQLGCIFPYEGFGKQWNEENQARLQKIVEGCDYVNRTSHRPYENPSQLKSHTAFLLEHSDGALLVYDREADSKAKWLYNEIQKIQERKEYSLFLIDFDDLQDAIENIYEK